MRLSERFEKFEDVCLMFDGIKKKRSNRPDLHAFLLLDELQPSDRDMIGASEHDEYYLSIDCKALAKVITDAQIEELVRCGVRYEEEYDTLCLFAGWNNTSPSFVLLVGGNNT